MPLIRLLFVLLAALVGLAGTPAAAQVTAYAAGQGAVNRIEVGIDVRASVRDRCGFASAGAPGGTLDQAEFDRTGLSRDFAIRLNCSGASRVAVTSRNGALVQDGAVAGYSSSAPYQVQLRLAADNGTVAMQSCDAATLKAAGTCAFSGTASGTAGLRLGAASYRQQRLLPAHQRAALHGQRALAGRGLFRHLDDYRQCRAMITGPFRLFARNLFRRRAVVHGRCAAALLPRRRRSPEIGRAHV